MKKIQKTLTTTIAILLCAAALNAAGLETVWEKIYDIPCARTHSTIEFSFDLASSPDKIMIISTFSHTAENSGFIDSSTFSLFQVSTDNGESVTPIFSVTSPRFLKPILIKKYGDTIHLYNHFDWPVIGNNTFFMLHKIRAVFSNHLNGFIPNESYYRYVIDTSLKGVEYASGIRKLTYNHSSGLINQHIGSRGMYIFERLGTVDSLTRDTLNSGNLFDDIGIDTTNLHIHSKHGHEIDSNNYLFISSIIRTDDKGLGILETNGILVVHFDAVGNIISKKFIDKKDFDGSGYVSYERVYYANGNIYIIGKPSHPYFIEITLDGELVRKIPFDYCSTDILKKYKDRDYINLGIYANDKKEIYFYGGVMYPSGGGGIGGNYKIDTNTYSMYFAKYDENMKLLYEKEWKGKEVPQGSYISSSINNMLIKDGYIYLQGKITPRTEDVNSDPENSEMYIAKFKETDGSIPEPTIIKNYSLFPNPASDDCTLSMDLTESGSISISLSDMLGRDIMQIYDGYAEAGAFSKAFNTKHLASGVYSVIIRIGGKAKVEKLIINK